MTTVSARDWGWRYANRRAWAARHLSFSMAEGERVLLLGPSGAGKSTLLAGLAGVLGSADEGQTEGHLEINGLQAHTLRGHAGLVLQEPASQIVMGRVGDDVAFGCENLALPADKIWNRVRSSLAGVGLALPLDHSTSRLSGGEQQRLVLAGALAMGADLLLLDEPTANLDPVGVTQVCDAVADALADRRRSMIVVEHHTKVWVELVDRVIVMTPEGIVADGTPARVFATQGSQLAAMGVWVPGLRGGLDTRRRETRLSPAILSTHDLTIGHDAEQVASGINVDIPAAASTMITGANGVGKTTLALTLAGLTTPLAGHVEASPSLAPPGRPGPHTWKSRELLTRIGTVFQSPDHQFVASSVADEIAIGLRALKVSPSARKARVSELLGTLRLAHLANANPFSLSGGEKRRLSVGTVLACQPSVIVLDEPTFGQDRLTWGAMVNLIADLVRQGTTIVSATHDEDFIHALADHHIRLSLNSPIHRYYASPGERSDCVTQARQAISLPSPGMPCHPIPLIPLATRAITESRLRNQA